MCRIVRHFQPPLQAWKQTNVTRTEVNRASVLVNQTRSLTSSNDPSLTIAQQQTKAYLPHSIRSSPQCKRHSLSIIFIVEKKEKSHGARTEGLRLFVCEKCLHNNVCLGALSPFRQLFLLVVPLLLSTHITPPQNYHIEMGS